MQTERTEIEAAATSRLSAAALGELLKRLLHDGLPVELPVTGASMTPCIRSGDIVTFQPASAPRLGDVIATLGPRARLKVHRVVRIRDGAVQTRGDAAATRDPEARTEEILGRVVLITRNGSQPHFGLGPERVLLAALSAAGWLAPTLRVVANLARLWRAR